MKNIHVLAAVLFVIGSVIGGSAQTSPFSEAKGIPADAAVFYDFEKWNFSIGDNNYLIDRSGNGKRTGRNPRDFKIPLEKDEYVDRVIYYAGYKKDILLLGELSYPDAGSGFLIRIDGKNLTLKWQLPIPAFNIARGLIEGDAAYLAAIGYAAKIDLATGKEIWKHEDFYRKYRETGAFNIFEVPKIDGETVIYEEKGIYQKSLNVIVFNKNSGEVLEVILNQ